MIDNELKQAMAGLLDAEPMHGVDVDRALDAGRSARRARQVKVGLACVLAAAVIGAGAPVAFSHLGSRADVLPAVTPTPTPSLSGMAADLVFGDAVVRADSSHGRAFAIIPIHNGGSGAIGVAGIGYQDVPGGDPRGLSQRVGAIIANDADARRATTVPLDQIAGIVARVENQVKDVVLAPGDTAVMIVAVTAGCPNPGPIPVGNVWVMFADPGVHALHAPAGAVGYDHPLIDASAATPGWLSEAWSAAC